MKNPTIHPSAKIAPNATVKGDVTLEAGVNVWYGSIIRGDVDSIYIGENTNVQDGCILHTSHGCPLNIGKGVTMGHGAIVHGCTVGDNTLIGMGAIIMDKAVVGKNCIVAAGSVVIGGTVVPDGSMVMGSPAKVKRETRPEELEKTADISRRYVKYANEEL